MFFPQQRIVSKLACPLASITSADSIRARAGEDIYALFGGTHLVEADDARIQSSICGLRSDGVGIIGMCHCSGLHAEEMAREALGASASGLSVGDTAVIG